MQHAPEQFKANADAALADRTLKVAIDRTTGTAERKRSRGRGRISRVRGGAGARASGSRIT